MRLPEDRGGAPGRAHMRKCSTHNETGFTYGGPETECRLRLLRGERLLAEPRPEGHPPGDLRLARRVHLILPLILPNSQYPSYSQGAIWCLRTRGFSPDKRESARRSEEQV